jgi:hypothetical protein
VVRLDCPTASLVLRGGLASFSISPSGTADADELGVRTSLVFKDNYSFWAAHSASSTLRRYFAIAELSSLCDLYDPRRSSSVPFCFTVHTTSTANPISRSLYIF